MAADPTRGLGQPLASIPLRSWRQLPAVLRAEVEAVVGAQLVDAVTVPGPNPGLRTVVTASDGRRFCCTLAYRAIDEDYFLAAQGQARIAARLPPAVPAPPFAWAVSDDDWHVLAFEFVGGCRPELPWTPSDLNRVLAALTQLAGARGARRLDLPPAAPHLADLTTGWRSLAEADDGSLAEFVPWAAERVAALADVESGVLIACEGEAIVHGNVCADIVWLAADDVYFLQWAQTTRGPTWLDLVMLLPTVAMQGVRGELAPMQPGRHGAGRAAGAWLARTFDSHPLACAAHPDDLRAVVAGLAGYYLDRARRRDSNPAGRGLHLAQGVCAAAWLERLGI